MEFEKRVTSHISMELGIKHLGFVKDPTNIFKQIFLPYEILFPFEKINAKEVFRQFDKLIHYFVRTNHLTVNILK